MFCECKHQTNIIFTGLFWSWQQISNKRGEIRGHLKEISQLNEGRFIRRIKIAKEKEVKNNNCLSPRAY